jgi:hypothetical protein
MYTPPIVLAREPAVLANIVVPSADTTHAFQYPVPGAKFLDVHAVCPG